MKGSPPLRAFLLLLTLLAMGWPLMQLTRRTLHEEPSGGSVTLAENAPSVTEKIPLVLSATKAAELVEVRHLGAVVWSKENPAAQESLELNLTFPAEGIELTLTVRWSGKELAALRLQLTTPEGKELERSVWGAETVEAVVSFP